MQGMEDQEKLNTTGAVKNVGGALQEMVESMMEMPTTNIAMRFTVGQALNQQVKLPASW